MTKSVDGFTLVELMIVIAIIGILASIAMPLLGTISRKSRETATISNLKAIRSAVAYYYTDTLQYPTSLTVLVPAYIKDIPLKDTPPYHPAGNSTGAGSMASMVLDRGDWFYDNNPNDSQFGSVYVNCTHPDVKGNVWTSY